MDIVSVYSQRLHKDHVHVIEHFSDIRVHDVIDYANSLTPSLRVQCCRAGAGAARSQTPLAGAGTEPRAGFPNFEFYSQKPSILENN